MMNTHLSDTVDSYNPLNMETSAPLNQSYIRANQHQVSSWPNVHSNFAMLQQRQWHNPIHQKSSEYMSSQASLHELQSLNFQYFLVIDFEATCKKEMKIYPQEIIEFPCVLVNGLTGVQEAVFQTYIRPVYHPLLTDYCKELTGIQQHQVDRGILLEEALLRHDNWLERQGVKRTNFCVVTWGDWDCRTMLESECRLKRITKPSYFNRWINLRSIYQEMFGGIRCDLKEAVERVGLVFEGRHHSGACDAHNTARLLYLLIMQGFRFSITSSLSTTDYIRDYPPNQSQSTSVKVDDTSAGIHSSAGEECGRYCFCGVKSNKCVIRKPGPTQGRWFFGCGNWTPARGSACGYFVWASLGKE